MAALALCCVAVIFSPLFELDEELDFSNLEYISSAGLRVLLSSHKKFAKLDGMKVKNVKEAVMEIFEITGFADILVIE